MFTILLILVTIYNPSRPVSFTKSPILLITTNRIGLYMELVIMHGSNRKGEFVFAQLTPET